MRKLFFLILMLLSSAVAYGHEKTDDGPSPQIGSSQSRSGRAQTGSNLDDDCPIHRQQPGNTFPGDGPQQNQHLQPNFGCPGGGGPQPPQFIVTGPSQLAVNGTGQMTASFNGQMVNPTIVSWVSLTPSILLVDSNGIVTALASGSGTIQGTFQSAQAAHNISVQPLINSFLVSGPKSMFIGDAAQMLAFADRVEIDPALVSWTAFSEDSASFVVTALNYIPDINYPCELTFGPESSAGPVIPVSPGNVITLMANGQWSIFGGQLFGPDGSGGTNPCDPLIGFGIQGALIGKWDNDPDPFFIGSALTVVVPSGATTLQLGMNDFNFPDNSGSVIVQFGNPVINIDVDGVVTAIEAGEATVVGSYLGLSDSYFLSVSPGLEIIAPASIQLGETVQFGAIFDNLPVNPSLVSWTLLTKSTLSDDGNGVFTGISNGPWQVEATFMGATKTVMGSVVPQKIGSVISNQFSGSQWNRWPRASKSHPSANANQDKSDSTPVVLMAVTADNSAQVLVTADFVQIGAKVGVRVKGSSQITAVPFNNPLGTLLEFEAEDGAEEYEFYSWVDSDGNCEVNGAEIESVFEARFLVITKDDYEENISDIELLKTVSVLNGYADDLSSWFLNQDVTHDFTVVTSDNYILGATRYFPDGQTDPSQFGLSHILGLEWSPVPGTCTADIPHFKFQVTSDWSRGLVTTDAVTNALESHIIKTCAGQITADFAGKVVGATMDYTKSFCVTVDGSSFQFGDSFERQYKLSIGGFQMCGSMMFKMELNSTGQAVLQSISYNGFIRDLYDFNYGANIRIFFDLIPVDTCEDGAAVQSGFPNLGQAGRIFIIDTCFEQLNAPGSAVTVEIPIP